MDSIHECKTRGNKNKDLKKYKWNCSYQKVTATVEYNFSGWVKIVGSTQLKRASVEWKTGLKVVSRMQCRNRDTKHGGRE